MTQRYFIHSQNPRAQRVWMSGLRQVHCMYSCTFSHMKQCNGGITPLFSIYLFIPPPPPPPPTYSTLSGIIYLTVSWCHTTPQTNQPSPNMMNWPSRTRTQYSQQRGSLWLWLTRTLPVICRGEIRTATSVRSFDGCVRWWRVSLRRPQALLDRLEGAVSVSKASTQRPDLQRISQKTWSQPQVNHLQVNN